MEIEAEVFVKAKCPKCDHEFDAPGEVVIQVDPDDYMYDLD